MLKFCLPGRPVFVCLGIVCALLQSSRGRAQTWREVQSPHFRVVTDGSDRDGREVAKAFEQMRSVFELRFHSAVLETGAPLLIVAVREAGLHSLGNIFWKDRDRVRGEFFRGWEQQFAMVRLNSSGEIDQSTVFHEYTHSVLHANVHWLPLWLDEGLAEFYAYTRFQGDRIYVGAPSIRYRHLQSESLIPLSELLSADSRSIGNNATHNDLFYGEAWAAVHYMMFGPEMAAGSKLERFIALLQSGKPQLQAFQEVFGDPKAFQQRLSIYLSKFTMSAGLLPPLPVTDAKSFAVKILTPAKADEVMGTFNVGAHQFAEGTALLQKAASADPALAGPHEELGFLAWKRGEDETAKEEWRKAVSLDPSRHRSAFALLMSGTPLKQQNEEQLGQTHHALEAIQTRAPKFAPVYVELALIEWRLGKLNQAYKHALAAEKLEPWRAGYHLLTAYILLQGHQEGVARDAALNVAARWRGSDHDEAVDLLHQLPAGMQQNDLTLALPKDVSVLRGTIVSSSCGKDGLSLMIQPEAAGAKPLAVRAAARYESGFSDTLWVGEDHYTPCFHLAGLPAVVAYKADASGTNTFQVLEVRDDLPELHL